jgi:hypothetical protein
MVGEPRDQQQERPTWMEGDHDSPERFKKQNTEWQQRQHNNGPQAYRKGLNCIDCGGWANTNRESD